MYHYLFSLKNIYDILNWIYLLIHRRRYKKSSKYHDC